jgi:hypothetical protein
MKKLLCLLSLVALSAIAQTPAYNLTTISLGTNAVPANATLALPLLVNTVITTNNNTSTAVYYSATNTNFKTTNTFTLPSVTNIVVTNTFISSNVIYGCATKTWTDYMAVTNYNPNVYYITNGASRTTNRQTASFNVPVNFTATGTNCSYSTNLLYGATTVDVSRSATAIVLFSANLTGAGTSAVTLNYQPVIDGVTTNSGAASSVAITMAGTATVSTNLSINVGAFGQFKLINLVNANGTAVTNIVLKVAQKVSAP